MSLERNRYGFDGEISFECDKCGDELHTETANMRSALDMMKQDGWKVVKDADGWSHICISCVERGRT